MSGSRCGESSAIEDSLGSCPKACGYIGRPQSNGRVRYLWHCLPERSVSAIHRQRPGTVGNVAYEPANFFAAPYFSQPGRGGNTATRAHACSVRSAEVGAGWRVRRANSSTMVL
jgi:hypothetical protein